MENQECFWPLYQVDKELMERVGEYQGVPVFLTEPEDFINFTWSQRDFRNLTSIDIIKKFLCSKELLYENIELV